MTGLVDGICNLVDPLVVRRVVQQRGVVLMRVVAAVRVEHRVPCFVHGVKRVSLLFDCLRVVQVAQVARC